LPPGGYFFVLKMPILPVALTELSILSRAREKAADYYAPLLDRDDAIVKIGAWCALLDRENVSPGQYDRVVELASLGAIQSRAFRFFEANWEHELAAKVAAKIATSEAAGDVLARRADLACDDAAAVEAHRYRFLATGRLDALVAMVGKQEQAGGWRSALPLALKVLILNPHDPFAADLVLRLLYNARQQDLLGSTVDLLKEHALHPYVVMLYEAALKLMDGDAEGCRKALATLDAARPPRPDVLARVRPLALRLNAEAIEKLGDYERAYEAFTELNAADNAKPAGDDYFKVVLAAAAQKIPPLPADPKTKHFTMTGFPRSGTTLLENALAAHPRIETFEEIPAVSSMQLYLDHRLPTATTDAEAVAVGIEARERYYDEEQRRHRKPGAEVFIDKMPMRSAEAGLMMKMFPDKRYVFSIRHPFDVVLSCFKQQFSRNIAMEQFRTFEGAVKLYDFAMEQWFMHHSMDDTKVHYLRYDDLVTRFEPSMRDVLGFLGVEWDPAVLSFAELADNRFARTPSYQKVRQGLSIGVQSSWRNYGFLFQSAAAKPLHKWVEFFGYSDKSAAA
jgi:Sulfotransferase family